MRVNKRQASGLAQPRPTTHRVVAESSSSARRAVMTSGRARLRGECRQHSCGPGGAQRDLARRHPTSASPELTGAIRAVSANAPLSHPFSVFGGRGLTVWGCGDGPEIFMRDWKLSSPHGSRQRGSSLVLLAVAACVLGGSAACFSQAAVIRHSSQTRPR